jgi:phage-related protein
MKTYKRRTVLTLQRMLQGDCEHRVQVTRIGDGYNIRVFTNDTLNQEARVYDRQHIGTEAKSMLRMEDKCGNISKYADAARFRNKPYM